MSTDLEWEEWGRKDPYFGVITHEKYRLENLTEEAKREFFRSGRDHVSHVLDTCRRHVDRNFSPKRVLDFGCGVGRLVVPFAEIAEHVVGVDVSDSMLEEARRNCEKHRLPNVTLLRGDDDLSLVEGHFDLIHSWIVFQHIPTDRGRRILAGLLGHLGDRGVCAVHITYAKAMFAASWGIRPAEPPVRVPFWKRLRGALRRRVGRLAARAGCQPARETREERSRDDPGMQMNSYNLSEVLFIIQSVGVRDLYVEMTDHGGELGAFLYFRKPGGGD